MTLGVEMVGTAAVRLNDNLLHRTSLPEIRAVMAHELGHDVLNHAPKMLMQFGLLILDAWKRWSSSITRAPGIGYTMRCTGGRRWAHPGAMASRVVAVNAARAAPAPAGACP